MTRFTRRSVLAATLAAPAIVRAQSLGSEARVVVVGAGVFGAWTAEHLRRDGVKVLLLDAWGPAHARASSGGESRMTRGAYGSDEVYTKMARDSLAEWRRLSAKSELPLFQETGVLFFFGRREAYLEDSIAVHRRLGLPTELLDQAAMARRFPQIDFTGVEAGLYEPGFGALIARRAVQELIASYVPTGGLYEQEAVLPPQASSERLGAIRTRSGRAIEAIASYSRPGRGCPSCSRICSGDGSFRPGRRCSSSRRSRVTAASSPGASPAGPISTRATSITVFPTWRVAA